MTGFDPLKSEVTFAFSYSQDESDFDVVYAYDIVRRAWREVHTSVIPGAFFLMKKAICSYGTRMNGKSIRSRKMLWIPGMVESIILEPL